MKRLLVVAIVVSAFFGASFASAARLTVAPRSLSTFTAALIQPLGLGLANGGTAAGLAEAGDVVTVTFPKALNPTSLCSTWTATGTQTIAANGVLTVSIAGDQLTASTSSAACGGAFALGSISLGATYGPATFAGQGNGGRSTATYDPATRALTIVLGTKTGTTSAVTAATTATYTPDAALRYVDGSSVLPAVGTTTGVHL